MAKKEIAKQEEMVMDTTEIVPRDKDTAVVNIQNNATPVNVADMSLLSVEQQDQILPEYSKRREHFLKWVFEQMVEGVHYGFPPGCEVKFDDQGNILQWSRKKNAYVVIPKEQWRAKPSLYKAGALFLTSLLRVKARFETSKDGNDIVSKCSLYAADGQTFIGEASGSYPIGGKGMDRNAATKMSEKRSLTAAILMGFPVIGELFTQDIEDNEKGKPQMTLKERKQALLGDVEDKLKKNNSKWGGTVQGWLQEAVASFQDEAGSQLKTIGAVDAFEKALEAGEINLNTGEYKKNAE